MRQILFQGKTVKTGEWIQGCLTYYIDPEFHAFIEDPITMEKLEVIPASVGEFIGVTDKHGKKIFEGDVITTEDHPIKGSYIVEYTVYGFDAVNIDETAENHRFLVAGYYNIEVVAHSYDVQNEEEE